MRITKRCVYNALRDAASANGLVCVTSWDEIADTCQIMPRQAQELTTRLDRDGLLVRSGAMGQRCFAPLDPSRDRRQAFFYALYDMQFPLMDAARIAFMRAQGRPITDISAMLAIGVANVTAFDEALRSQGFYQVFASEVDTPG